MKEISLAYKLGRRNSKINIKFVMFSLRLFNILDLKTLQIKYYFLYRIQIYLIHILNR